MAYSPADIEALIASEAKAKNLDPNIFRRMLVAESNLNPSIVNPKSGAAGIAQFIPSTARQFNIDPLDPGQAIPASALYMRTLLNKFGGDYGTALAAYNWGPGNVAKYGTGAAPDETRAYVAKITGNQPMNPSYGGGGAGGTAMAMDTAPVNLPSQTWDNNPLGHQFADIAMPAPEQEDPNAPTLADIFIRKGTNVNTNRAQG